MAVTALEWSTVPGPETAHKLPVDRIVAAADNPRHDLGDIEGLTRSIRENGLLQPIVVGADHDEHGNFTLLAGHRRLAAIVAGGWTHVYVVVDVHSGGEQATRYRRRAQLIENLHRKDLDPVEEARGIGQLLDTGDTQAAVAELLGVTQPHVSKRRKLLDLPDLAQAAVSRGRDAGGITIEEGLALADLPSETVDRFFVGDDVPDRGEIQRAVAHHDRSLSVARAIAASKRAAKAGGHAVMVGPATGARAAPEGRAVPLRFLAAGEHFDQHYNAAEVQPEAHASLPCHLILIDPATGGSAPACSDPIGQHPAPGPATKSGRQQRRDEVTEEWRGREARRAIWVDLARTRDAFSRELIHQYVTGIEVVALAGIVLPCTSDGDTETVCEALGFDTPNLDWDEELEAQSEWLATQDPRKVLHAMAVLAGNQAWPNFDNTGNPLRVVCRAHLRHLEAHGYQPHEMELEAVAEQLELVETRTCRDCGCTDESGCLEGCSWVEADLCSACQVVDTADIVTVRQTGRGNRLKWSVDCTCGPVAVIQTTRAYADQRAAEHLAEKHPQAVSA